MQLTPDDQLIWSPTVANSRMNRSRNASGINSYEQEFKFKPEQFLENTIAEKGSGAWLDICCGEGRALLQAAQYFNNKNYLQKIKLIGIDLIENENSNSEVQFSIMAFSAFKSAIKFDLITCVHGLHYIGDKLAAIEKAISLLNVNGLFVANLDLSNICIKDVDSNRLLKDKLKKENILYDSGKKIIKKVGHGEVNFGCHYLGADENSGPNYTGQDAVTSYYSTNE